MWLWAFKRCITKGTTTLADALGKGRHATSVKILEQLWLNLGFATPLIPKILLSRLQKQAGAQRSVETNFSLLSACIQGSHHHFVNACRKTCFVCDFCFEGVKHGLRLLLNIEQYEYMQGPQLDTGVKVGKRKKYKVQFNKEGYCKPSSFSDFFFLSHKTFCPLSKTKEQPKYFSFQITKVVSFRGGRGPLDSYCYQWSLKVCGAIVGSFSIDVFFRYSYTVHRITLIQLIMDSQCQLELMPLWALKERRQITYFLNVHKGAKPQKIIAFLNCTIVTASWGK